MTTNQHTCSSSASRPDGIALLAVLAFLLVAATVAAGPAAGDPWSLVHAILRGPHAATQEHDDSGRRSNGAVRGPVALAGGPAAGGERAAP